VQKRIFICFPLESIEMYNPLVDEGCELIFGAKPSHPVVGESKEYTESELIEKCQNVTALLASPRVPISGRVLNSAAQLVCICQRGIGFDNVDVQTASKLGILITNAPIELEFVSVAEHTVALILALAKKLKIASKIPCEGKEAYFDERLSTITLSGKTVGIIGLGRIGIKVAALLRPFNVKILGCTRTRISEEKAKNIGIQQVDLDVLLKESDFITIHVPLTPETRHMISEREFNLMKNTAYIINTSRGAVIDEAALIKALKNGKIAGAALDVVEEEPITPDNPLLKMENVIITPHIAGRGPETIIEGEKVAVESCLKILRGVVPENVVNPEAIPKWRERINREQPSFSR
jgi:D-3-phosphoglycerate dehydrogenase